MDAEKNRTENDVPQEEMIDLPVLNIRMMSDEEWNRLAYQNYLERRCME